MSTCLCAANFHCMYRRLLSSMSIDKSSYHTTRLACTSLEQMPTKPRKQVVYDLTALASSSDALALLLCRGWRESGTCDLVSI